MREEEQMKEMRRRRERGETAGTEEEGRIRTPGEEERGVRVSEG